MYGGMGMSRSGMPSLGMAPMSGMPTGRQPDSSAWDIRLSPDTGRVADLNQKNPYLTPALASMAAAGNLNKR